MSSHALLSASGASRWMACPPSARYELEFEKSQSDYADEGTLAHELANYLITQRGWNLPDTPKLDEIKANKFYNEEMHGYCVAFADHVIEKIQSAPSGAIFLLEQRLNMSEYIPEGFGTVDVCIASDGWLEIDDLKYGKGVPVEAKDNKQLKIYALGALREVDLLFNIQKVRMTIYQPRIDNIDSFEMTVEDLKRWGYETLRPAAKIAFAGEGEFFAGEHCRFCAAKAVCSVNAKRNLQIAKYQFAPPNELRDDQIVAILSRAEEFKRFVKGVETYALKEAIGGKKWPGLKLVAGRSFRKITKEDEIAKDLLDKGYDSDLIFKKKINGITILQKNLKKEDFRHYVEPRLVKPQGSPTLVDESDGRKELNSLESIQADFEDEMED